MSSTGSIASDPLVVFPIQAALADGAEGFEDSEGFIDIAPDDLHKANTSGADPYQIAVPDPRADAVLLTIATSFISSITTPGVPLWRFSPATK